MFKYPSLIFELFLSVNKLMFITFVFYKFGFLLGIMLYIITMNLYYTILSKFIVKSPMLNQSDKIFLGDKLKERISQIAVCDISDFSTEKIKERIIYGLKKVPKINSKLKYFLGNFFWKQVELSDSRLKELIEIKENLLKDINEVIEYAYTEANIPLDLHTACLKCYIIPYTDKNNTTNINKQKGALVFKVDHSFSDGLGVLNYMTCLADNFSLDMLPKKNKTSNTKNIKEISNKQIKYLNVINIIFLYIKNYILLNIKNYLKFIIFEWYYTLKLLLKPSDNNIFNKKANQMGKVRFTLPLEYDIDVLKKISRNNFNVKNTLNELVIALFSATFKKLDRESKDISIFIPIGKTKMEDSLERINKYNLNNNALGVQIKLPLIDELNNSTINTIQSILNKQIVSQKFIAYGIVSIVNFLTSILPIHYIKVGVESSAKKIDLLFSNLPGPQKTLYLNGCKIENIMPFASTGIQKGFIILYSYNGKINIMCNFDEGQNINPQEFKKCFNEVLNNALNYRY